MTFRAEILVLYLGERHARNQSQLCLLDPPGDQYALKMRLVDHVFDEQVIDSLTVKIILPEGAK